MSNGTGDTPNYIDTRSSPSTTIQKIEAEESRHTSIGTGEPEYGTSKPYRIRFKVQRIKKS